MNITKKTSWGVLVLVVIIFGLAWFFTQQGTLVSEGPTTPVTNLQVNNEVTNTSPGAEAVIEGDVVIQPDVGDVDVVLTPDADDIDFLQE